MKVLQTLVLCVAGSVGIAAYGSPVLAQTGYSITGGMSNFDCVNHCDEPCNEFECEIEGIHPEDVVHCYHNGNYGAPTVTLSSSGTSTIIDYRNPQHATPVGSIEHFGISLRSLSAAGSIRVRWMVGGRSATVNGQIPVAGGGSAPASQPVMPAITADMGMGSVGQDGVTCTVTNNDAGQAIWIKRRAQVSAGVVTLESLMPNNPVVTTTVPLDSVPMYVGPGQSVSYTSDLIEIEDNESVVFAAEYFQDLTQQGPFNNTHTVGPMLGNVMTASIASPGSGCDTSSPVVLVQPINTTVPLNHSADLRVNADGNDLPLTYQWLRDGVALANTSNFHGVTTDELSIDEVSSATEGFYSCRISNTCGVVVTQSALVFVEGHNNPPARPSDGACCDPATGACTLTSQTGCAAGSTWNNAFTCSPSPCVVVVMGGCCDNGYCEIVAQTACQWMFLGANSTCGPASCCPSDFDLSGTLSVQDIFAYLNAWFAGDPRTDTDGDGIAVQDIFNFLGWWFAGC